MPLPLKEPGTWLSRWWKGLTRFTKLSFIAGTAVVTLTLGLSVVVGIQEDIQFAINVVVGIQDPYAADSDFAPVVLALINTLLVPVLVGGAIGAAIGLASRRRPPRASAALQDVIADRDRKFGQYDKSTSESHPRENGPDS